MNIKKGTRICLAGHPKIRSGQIRDLQKLNAAYSATLVSYNQGQQPYVILQKRLYARENDVPWLKLAIDHPIFL